MHKSDIIYEVDTQVFYFQRDLLQRAAQSEFLVHLTDELFTFLNVKLNCYYQTRKFLTLQQLILIVQTEYCLDITYHQHKIAVFLRNFPVNLQLHLESFMKLQETREPVKGCTTMVTLRLTKVTLFPLLFLFLLIVIAGDIVLTLYFLKLKRKKRHTLLFQSHRSLNKVEVQKRKTKKKVSSSSVVQPFET